MEKFIEQSYTPKTISQTSESSYTNFGSPLEVSITMKPLLGPIDHYETIGENVPRSCWGWLHLPHTETTAR